MQVKRETTEPGTPALLRTLNQRALLERLRRDGPLSRADLARRSGLSKPTVSQALAGLEEAGLVRAVGPAAPSRGRTGMLYEPDPTAGYVVGIDIGRAWIRVAVADLAGTVAGRSDTRNRARSAENVVRTAATQARAVVAEAGVRWNLHVGVRYLEAWLDGSGAEPIHNLMEDLATSEISRSQLWQWRTHGVQLADGRPMSADLYAGVHDEELSRLRRALPDFQWTDAAALLDELVLSDRFAEFLTLLAYPRLV